jgi:hypothetical protein
MASSHGAKMMRREMLAFFYLRPGSDTSDRPGCVAPMPSIFYATAMAFAGFARRQPSR